jgi:hypothetical protein
MMLNPLGTAGPEGTTFSREGQVIHFTPVVELPPGMSLIYNVRVQAKQIGQYRFKAELNATGVPPISKEAGTEVTLAR